MIVLLAGCAQTPSPPALPFTEESANLAIDAALAELTSTSYGNQTRIHLVTVENTNPEPADSYSFEWGSANVEHATYQRFPEYVSSSSQKPGLELQLYCTPQREILIAPNGTFEARRGQAWCPLIDGKPVKKPNREDPPALGVHEMLRFHRVDRNVTLGQNGTASAIVTSHYDSQELEVVINASGKIVTLQRDWESKGGTFVEVGYGERKVLPLPTHIDDRAAVPRNLRHGGRQGNVTTVVVPTETGLPTPLGELTLLLQKEDVMLAEFPLEQDAVRGGFGFQFVDADHDAHYSAGDSIRLSGNLTGVQVIMHDEWAGHDAGYVPYQVLPPAPWVAFLLLLLGCAASRRR